MKYQERVSIIADLKSLYKRVKKDPAIRQYRGYTQDYSYGYDEENNEILKVHGEHWFDNPGYKLKCDTEEIWDKFKPGETYYCLVGGIICKADVVAVGKIRTAKNESWHVRYFAHVANAKIRCSWMVGDKKLELYETYEQAEKAQDTYMKGIK